MGNQGPGQKMKISRKLDLSIGHNERGFPRLVIASVWIYYIIILMEILVLSHTLADIQKSEPQNWSNTLFRKLFFEINSRN